MFSNSNPLPVDYSDLKLRILVEEYIAMQKTEFSFNGVCSYILYRAMEEGHAVIPADVLYESNLLSLADCNRISHILKTIIKEGRISISAKDDRKEQSCIDEAAVFEKKYN